MSQTAIRACLEASQERTLAFLEAMVLVNSGPANPVGITSVGRIAAAQFAGLGFAHECLPSRESASGPHLFLSRPGTSPNGICLVAHLDTVYSAEEEELNGFTWLAEGERIYGPGTSDDKGGIAMIAAVLEALRILDTATFDRTHWLVALNAAEETMSPDFPGAVAQRLPPNTLACLVFEGAHRARGGFAIPIARKGSVNLRLTVHGRGAHGGGRHQDGANAIVALSRLLPQIADLTDYTRELTVNPGLVSGGLVVNRVPAVAEARINIRSFDPRLTTSTVQRISDVAAQAAGVRAFSDGFACSAELDIIEETAPWPGGEETARLFDLWRDAATTCELALEAERRGGVSDANVLCHLAPTLDGLGPSGGNDHCSERSVDGSKRPEYVEPDSFVSLGTINTLALRRLIAGGSVS